MFGVGYVSANPSCCCWHLSLPWRVGRWWNFLAKSWTKRRFRWTRTCWRYGETPPIQVSCDIRVGWPKPPETIRRLGGLPVLLLVTVATAGFLALANRRGEAIFVVIAITSGALVTHFFKLLIGRPRPSVVPHLADIHTLSFPSGHSMMSTVVYVTLATLLAAVVAHTRLKLYLLAVGIGLAVLIGCTRVVLGVHYPSDVLAGWCAGIAWAGLCRLVFRWFQWSHWMRMKEPVEVDDEL